MSPKYSLPSSPAGSGKCPPRAFGRQAGETAAGSCPQWVGGARQYLAAVHKVPVQDDVQGPWQLPSGSSLWCLLNAEGLVVAVDREPVLCLQGIAVLVLYTEYGAGRLVVLMSRTGHTIRETGQTSSDLGGVDATGGEGFE